MSAFKSTVIVRRRKSILDPEGKAIEHALHSLEFTGCSNVRMGRMIELTVEAEDLSSAKNLIESVSKKLLTNPIIEDFTYEIAPVDLSLR